MAYQWITWAQARAALAARLDDPSNVYWADAENAANLTEALRTWQSLSRYWRSRMAFSLEEGENWYDLTQQTGTLIPYTVTDAYLEQVMAYHLLEPLPSGNTWNGTDMFTTADLTLALERRRNQFLLETGMVTSVVQGTSSPPPVNLVSFADNVIDIRRISWQDRASLAFTSLWTSDEWTAQALSPSWSTGPQPVPPGPSSYSVTAVMPLQCQLIPPAANAGTASCLVIQAGAPLDPATPVLLGIPDDFSWVVKWGALADLLGREGQSRDAERAAYCEARFKHGILAARSYSSLLTCYLDGTQVFPIALTDMDTFAPGWENATPGQPTACALGSWNQAIVTPEPDANPHSLMADVLQNAPIPANNAAYVQIGREEFDTILDYAVHLSSFKEGGNEFKQTMGLWQNFLRLAQIRNERLAAASSSVQPMFDRAVQDERQRYRIAPEIPAGIAPETGG